MHRDRQQALQVAEALKLQLQSKLHSLPNVRQQR
jgi:hypothetical protein